MRVETRAFAANTLIRTVPARRGHIASSTLANTIVTLNFRPRVRS